MRMRALLSIVAVSLLLVALGCSSNPSNTASSSDSSATSPAGGSPESTAAGSGGSTRAAVKPVVETVVVPAGTTLTVRLGQSLGSKLSTSGQSFTASLASPVEVGGKAVIPSGAEAHGVVTDAKPLGRFKGGAVLQIRLNSITVAGAEHSIETSAVTRAEKGKGKRTAVMAGGGAAVGALIGGLAGGGKGAAIGALAGGGAGTAGAAYTGNKDIVLPAESAVTFKLEAPLELK